MLLDTVLALTAIEKKQQLAQEIRERAEEIARVRTLIRTLELQARLRRSHPRSPAP